VSRSPSSLRQPLALTIASLVSVFATSAFADEARTDLSSRVRDDAAAGRSYFAPTALTGDEGTATFSVRAPLYPAITGTFTYALTDRVEVYVGGGAVVVIDDESNDPNRAVGGGIKVQVLRLPRAAVALSAGVLRRPAFFHTDPFDDGWHEDALVRGALGAAATGCVDERCEVIVSAHAHAVPRPSDPDGTLLWGGGSLVAGRGRSRLVVDATAAIDGDDGVLLGYVGSRAAPPPVAFDAGALVVIDAHSSFPWPTLGLSARF